MATNSPGADFVESKEIPDSIQVLYDKASEADEILARSLSSSNNRPVVTDCGSSWLGGDNRDRAIVRGETNASAIVQRARLNSEQDAPHKRRYRQSKPKGIKPAIQIFFAGENTVGDPYVALIPFFISGKVKIHDKVLQLKHYYNVFGKCPLIVEDGSKLGAWVYSVT